MLPRRQQEDECQDIMVCQMMKKAGHNPAGTVANKTPTRRFSGDVDKFVEGSEKMTKGGAAAMHTICPIEIMTDGNRAVTESTGTVMIRFQHEGVEYDCTSYTRFSPG